MLNILVGTDWKTNRDTVLQMLSADVAQRQGGRILIVPELISHDTERRVAECAGDTASLYAEVLSFTRLAGRVEDTIGNRGGECLDNGGRMVAMAAAVRQTHSRLKSYASVLTRPEFLTGLVEAVDEFKRCCISAEDLRLASARTEGVFAQKLEELSLILEAYDAITAQGKRDPRDRMTWLLEQMEACDYAENHTFYIDGFPDFTRQHMAILEHLILNSPMVTISLNCDQPASKAMAFEKAGKTAMDIIRFAQNNAVPYQIRTLAPEENPLNTVCQRLYQGSTDAIAGINKHLHLYRAESIHDQCRCAAEHILQLVRSGYRFRDIGVVCADMAGYEDALRLVFSHSNIPVYRSGTDDVLQKSVVNSLLCAMNAALGGFERQDVIRYMKSILSPLTTDDCDIVENYSILWGINGGRWTTDWVNHPDGLGCTDTVQSKKRLEELNQLRRRLTEPLDLLRKGIASAQQLSQQVQALYTFFEDICLAQRLEQLADHMDSAGDNRSAQILNQLWDILLSALEQLHDMLGQSAWDADSFVRLFTLLLSQYDVGTIPTVLDAVMAGPVSAMRCHQVKHLFILGAQEGLLPGYSGTTGILTDREREQLRSLDIPLTGGGTEGLQSEFAEIYGVFASASDSITVICGSEQPSFIYSRLASMAGEEQSYTPNIGILTVAPTDAAAYLAAIGDRSGAQELDILEQYNAVSDRAGFTIGTVERENVESIYGNKLNLSASQVDKQADCRFSYFLRYGIRAKELKEATVDPAEFGTYFHAVLENTARHVMELGGFHKVSLEKTKELALMYSSQYISQRFIALDSSRVNYLFQRNVDELMHLIRELWLELSVSLFLPSQFEIGFGENKEMPAVSISGAKMPAQLGGFVDRVDVWNDGNNNYFRVVDYKSGQKSFDYCDVFNGMGLQMLLYMFALEQGGASVLGEHPIPVGVQYFSARFPYLSKDRRIDDEEAQLEHGKTLKRKGLILSDEAIMEAMEPEGAPARLSAGHNKNGDIIGDVADRDQFRMLRKYVFSILRKLVNEIASGNVAPNPYTRGDSHNACKYCPYGAVCHKSSVAGRRNYQTMKPQRFWDEIAKEVQDNG